jgi:hypothetical protein
VIVYGHDTIGKGHVFKLVNPGVVINNDLLQVSVAGTGQYIAMGWLAAQLQKDRSLDATIYRMLEAKFAAEAASGVGRATTVMTFRADGTYGTMPPWELEPVREIWNRLQTTSMDSAALKIIAESGVVTDIREIEQKTLPGVVQGSFNQAPRPIVPATIATEGVTKT